MIIHEKNQRDVTGMASANAVSSTENRVKANTNVEYELCHKKSHTEGICYTKGCDFCYKKGHVKETMTVCTLFK